MGNIRSAWLGNHQVAEGFFNIKPSGNFQWMWALCQPFWMCPFSTASQACYSRSSWIELSHISLPRLIYEGNTPWKRLRYPSAFLITCFRDTVQSLKHFMFLWYERCTLSLILFMVKLVAVVFLSRQVLAWPHSWMIKVSVPNWLERQQDLTFLQSEMMSEVFAFYCYHWSADKSNNTTAAVQRKKNDYSWRRENKIYEWKKPHPHYFPLKKTHCPSICFHVELPFGIGKLFFQVYFK